MKNVFSLLFMFSVLTGYAQDSGIATYKKEWINLYSESAAGRQDKIANPQKYREYRELEKLQQKLTKQLAYKLKFDKNRSFFYLEDLLSIENQADLALAKGPFQGEYYFNRKTDSVIWAIKALGEKFLVNLDKIDWKLEKKRKTISGYSCFKASAKIPLESGKLQSVVAWYTREIPLNYGPLQYNGLPGLVVQLETGSELYTLTKIQQKKITINDFKKATKYKIVDIMTQKFKELFEKKIKIAGKLISEILTINGVRFILENGSWGLIRASSNKPSLVIVTESFQSADEMKAIFKFIDNLLETTGKVGKYDQKI